MVYELWIRVLSEILVYVARIIVSQVDGVFMRGSRLAVVFYGILPIASKQKKKSR